jgi:hypothetical protein
VCDSEIGRQVRGGIFHDRFWTNLVAVAAPFPLLLLAIAAILAALPRSPKTADSAQQSE